MMRKISEATKITKVVSKVLSVLEKEDLTEEQIESVMKATEETLGITSTTTSKHCDCDCDCEEIKDCE